MKTLNVLLIALCLRSLAVACEEPPIQDRVYPQILDQANPVQSLLDRADEEWQLIYSRRKADIVAAHPLLFQAQVDERPHVWELCLFLAHVRLEGADKWWLLSFYRWPYGSFLFQREWQLANIGNVGTPVAFREYDAAPTPEQIKEHLEWSGWSSKPQEGFKFIVALAFNDYWKEMVGEDAPAEYQNGED